jgi:amidase
MNDLLQSSARSLIGKIRRKEVSSEELVRACLDRISEVNTRLNAVVELRAEAALAEARTADTSLARGDSRGLLHGLPVTVKEAIAVAGMIWSGGTKGRAATRATEDATPVKRLREAGAIILGTTNVPEMSFAYECDNMIYGRTNNPYDLSRTCGGSTGGEAAIIAAAGSPLGLGGDFLGSIRVPAHFCGIAGLRPNPGRVPADGYFPSGGALPPLLAQAGPMARYVEDLSLMLPIIAGPDSRDPFATPVPLRDPSAVDLRQLRVAFYTDNGIAAPSPAVAQAVQAAAGALADCGASVVEDRPPGVEESLDLFYGLIGADGGEGMRMLLRLARTGEPHALLDQFLTRLAPNARSAAEWMGTWTQWNLWRRSIFSFLEYHDVILSPVCSQVALPHGTTVDNLADFSYVHTWSLAATPAVVVRTGTSDEGLPIGIQIVPRCWREDLALAAALQIELALAGWRPPRTDTRDCADSRQLSRSQLFTVQAD